MRNDKLIAVLDRPDQERVRADLTTFFGPRAEVYLKTYDSMRAGTGRRRGQALGWCWPGFLFAFPWLFYRKMYIWGAVSLLLPFVVGLVVKEGAGGAVVVFALLGKSLYVQSALRRLMKADELGLAGEERAAYLRQAGGVSVAAGAAAGLVCAAGVALVLVEVFAPDR